jgi:hypothetical protein
VFDLRSYWRLLPAALSLLSLAGSPLTIGFLARAALYHQIFAKAQWLLLLGLLIVEALLLAAFLRIVLDVEQLDAEPEEEGRAKDPHHAEENVARSGWSGRHELGFGAGAFLSLAIVVLGLAPRLIHIHEPLPSLGGWFGLPTLPVWAALLLSVVAALTLYRSRDAILSPMEVWWPLIQRALRLDWAYTLIENLVQSIGELIWHITQVVQGAGYMSWVVLVFLIMVLFVIAR